MEESDGYGADTGAIDHYVGQIVNPALENFDKIASRLYANSGLSYAQMLGHSRLQGSTEFNDACRRMLDTFFQTHHTMSDLQRSLVQTVTRFRDNLRQSSAAYLHTDTNTAQSLASLTARLEGKDSGGAAR